MGKAMRLRDHLALATAALLAASFASAVLPEAASARPGLPHASSVTPTPVRATLPAKPAADPTAADNMTTAPASDLETATAPGTVGTVESGASVATWRTAGKLPVAIRGASAARVDLLDGTSRTRPIVARISGTTGPVGVRFSYQSLADRYGGDYAGRLKLVRLPECALSTPDAPACAAQPLASVADPATQTLSAAAVTSGSVVALAAAPSSDAGSYQATALQASATWAAGQNSGDFTWTYAMHVPPSQGGPAPKISLGYSAQSVDGRTAASNSQPSWIGEGFDYQPGSITRAYTDCADDGQSGDHDQCWGGDNATLSLTGHGGELIADATDPNLWHLKNDDGTRVQKLTDTTLGNGDNDGEYWKVTTADGTQYHFGRNKLPGWSTGKPVTGSTFTVPVFGNGTGEPCHGSTFAASWCMQAYQWNLDYVVDPHGNSMSLWYNQETNNYARAGTASSVSGYVRGGTLAHIDYGTRTESEFTATAPYRVMFDRADRCVTPGSTCTSATPSNWPDVPWDQQCTSSTSCTDHYSPVFFTQKMLGAVRTQVWTGTGTTYRDAETWTLNHVFKDPGDNHAKILWLNKLSHTGNVGTAVSVPDVTFTAVQMNNRVDLSGARDPIVRYRLHTIDDENGGELTVTYSAPGCSATSKPAAADTNTKLCYPVWWTPYGETTAVFEYFHKYVTTDVVQRDLTGGGKPIEHHYAYIGTPAWHYDEAEFVPAGHKSWGQWRGYGTVRVLTGGTDTAQHQVDTVYFRGMNGDKLSSGTRTVTIPADPLFGGAAIADEPWRDGAVRETITYNGLGDSAAVVSKQLNQPWEHGPTATRTRNGVTVNAYATATKTSTTKTAVTGGWRTTQTASTFDYDTGAANPTGRVMTVDDFGDTSTAADDRCTRNTYALNPATWSMTQLAEVVTVAASCGTTADPVRDTISDTRTYYDGATTFATTIAQGDATRIEILTGFSGTTPQYAQKAHTTFDVYGRPVDVYDGLDHKTTNAYVPAVGGPVTATSSTGPTGWTQTTTLEPAWKLPTHKVDVSGQVTDLAYDGLGRLTSVWLPGRTTAQTPSLRYTYTIRNSGGVSATSAAKLNAAGTGYSTTWTLYDGLAHAIQTQTPSPAGGRMIADTRYDSADRQSLTTSPYYDTQAPGANLVSPVSAQPGRTLSTYDNAGRVTVSAFQINGVEQWRTTTSYYGDHTDVAVPTGGTATATYTDGRGRTVAIRQFHGSQPTGAYDTTSYAYTPGGDQASITDALGNVWKYTYDQQHRVTTLDDPDKGKVTYTYDAMGNPLTTTDNRGNTVTTTYDALGRKTAVSSGGTQLAGWTYDTLKHGKLSSSTRYAGGQAYTVAITGYDVSEQPTGTTLTLPAAEGALAGTYTTATTYNVDGSQATSSPAVNPSVSGGLGAETLTYSYDAVGNTVGVSGAGYSLVSDYDELGRRSALRLTDGQGKTLTQVWSYLEGTGWVLEHGVLDEATSTVYEDLYTAYNQAGDIVSLRDKLAQYGAASDDNQCFHYDYLRRMDNAWTPANSDCQAAATTAGLGGPAPYWQSYGYDLTGDRTSRVDHKAAGNTTLTSAYPASGATSVRPHTVTSVMGSGLAAPPTANYTYDASGNTTSRPGETMTWDVLGHLATSTSGGQTTTYIYDADGNRLLAKNSTTTTLTLADAEYKLSGATVTATRYYGKEAVRTPSGLFWSTTDPHGTTDATFAATTLARQQQRTTPFGEKRGTTSTFAGSRTFVGGTADTTGTVHLGAREYDPALGRFISADPLFDPKDQQSWQGYAYADNAPTNFSDPQGTSLSCDVNGDCLVSSGQRKPVGWDVPPGPHCDAACAADRMKNQDRSKDINDAIANDVHCLTTGTVCSKPTVEIADYDLPWENRGDCPGISLEASQGLALSGGSVLGYGEQDTASLSKTIQDNINAGLSAAFKGVGITLDETRSVTTQVDESAVKSLSATYSYNPGTGIKGIYRYPIIETSWHVTVTKVTDALGQTKFFNEYHLNVRVKGFGVKEVRAGDYIPRVNDWDLKAMFG